MLDDKQVSRRHALIFSHGAGIYWLMDFGSVHGVFLNRRRLLEPARLNNLDQIHIAQHLIVFRQERAAKECAPVPPRDKSICGETDRGAHPFAELDYGVVLLTSEAGVQYMSENARRWVAHYFQAEDQETVNLPGKLRQWLQRQSVASAQGAASEPLYVTRGVTRLAVRLAENSAGQTLLLLAEGRPAFSTESLLRLGLTSRESDVLHWVAEGKSNPEIASILNMSIRTVESHLQSVFTQLDVQNRTAAMMRVMEKSYWSTV